MRIGGPVVPMAATAIDRVPDEAACPGGCRYEPKWDGFRALAIVNEKGGVRLWSRRLKSFNDAFPEVVLAVFDALPPGTVVDGEIVRWGRDGRLDFAALQRRHVAGRRRRELALTEPCHYVVFDVLETGGTDYRPRPLSERREVLERLLAGVPDTSRIVLCPQMRDVGEARVWFEVLPAQGIEGLVVKAASGRYQEGKRGWWKVKHRTTTEAVVQRRLPKFGFVSPNRVSYATVNVGELEAAFKGGETIDEKALKAARLVKGVYDGIKVLGEGALTKKFTVKVNKVTAGAREAISKAGGSVEEIALMVHKPESAAKAHAGKGVKAAKA